METGEDKFGVKDAIAKYYNQVRAEADKIFKGNSSDENDMIMDEIEEYICKRLYNKYSFPLIRFESQTFSKEFIQALRQEQIEDSGRFVKDLIGSLSNIWKLSRKIVVSPCGNMLRKVFLYFFPP